jgi:signal transduction histidine kinase
VHVRVPTGALTAGVWPAWLVLGGLGIVLVAGAVIVADRLGRSVVSPADEVAAAARRLAAGDRDARAPVAGPPEIADVARALNGLADRLDDLVAAEREAAADLSHRLRTPMTALRLDVEALAPGEGSSRLAADVRALEEAVDRLIRHARAGRASGGGSDLAEVVRQRVAFWTPLVEDEARDLAAVLPDTGTWVAVEAEDLAAAVDALVGNVLHHTEAGTALAVQVDAADGWACLRVDDAGPGFTDPAPVERGRSGGASTGLGLDICRRLAEEAGGRFELGRGALGGASVTLVLPVASRR